jgi:UDP-N-acetylmuramoyl-tripeptide--D-alanyl-D-alanine ligase
MAGATVVDDCRNSNPRSLSSMIDALASMHAERRILIAAEMPDLGASAEALHRECGRHAAQKKIDLVIGVGGLARALAEAACSAGVPAQFLETPEAAGECLSRQLRAGDAVLLKAPREAKLENALDAWRDSRAMKQGSAS